MCGDLLHQAPKEIGQRNCCMNAKIALSAQKVCRVLEVQKSEVKSDAGASEYISLTDGDGDVIHTYLKKMQLHTTSLNVQPANAQHQPDQPEFHFQRSLFEPSSLPARGCGEDYVYPSVVASGWPVIVPFKPSFEPPKASSPLSNIPPPNESGSDQSLGPQSPADVNFMGAEYTPILNGGN